MRNEAIALDDLVRPFHQIHEESRNLDLLKEFLKGKRYRLDCGHFSTPGHNLGSTMIILPNRTPEIICFSCYL